MAAAFPSQVSADQVGSYFVKQYYHYLQQQPNVVYQFYNEASTMVRVNGDAEESAKSILQIHALIMTLNFTGIEVKTLHSSNSWEGGVIVVVSGLVQIRGYNGRRNFVQTFFLAPQEKGYFVLNDIFHFLDEEQIHQPSVAMLPHGNYESNLNVPNPIPEPVSNYMLGGEIQTREFVASFQAEENIPLEYSIPDRQQQVSVEGTGDETHAEEPVASFPDATNTVWDSSHPSAVEPAGEQPKQTYASILRIAKGQSSNGAPPASLSNPSSAASDWHQAQQPTSQKSYPDSLTGPEKPIVEAVEVIAENDGEVNSVYVGNLPASICESDLEHEFKNFGRIRPNGVAIRSRKDSGGCYGFVEFEDETGIQNALKASPIQLHGRQIYVEERRPNSGIGRGRRGRGRGGYQSEAPRGRFGGRGFGRVSGQDGYDREYSNRPRGNGWFQRGPRQERDTFGDQISRNGQDPSSVAPY